MSKVETSKIVENAKELELLQRSKGMVEGTSFEFDKDRKLHIYHNGMDELIDRVLNDVNGEIYISSRGVANLMDIEHKKIIGRYIPQVISERDGAYVGPVSNTEERDTLHVEGVSNVPWFIETTYVGNNNENRKEFLISSVAFLYLCMVLPNGKKKHVNEMRRQVMLQVVERFVHYRSLLAINFQDYVNDIRELGKVSRNLLTKSIQLMLRNQFGKEGEKEFGRIYALTTKLIYDTILIPRQFHNGCKDKFNNDTLFLIHTSETIVASFISSMDMNGEKFNLETLRSQSNGIKIQILKHLSEKNIEDNARFFETFEK